VKASRFAAVAVAAAVWVVAYSPATPKSSGSIALIEPAKAEGATCESNCDGIGRTCTNKCFEKEKPCFKACPSPSAEEAKNRKKFDDDKCMAKCMDKVAPCQQRCYAERSSCRSRCE
jgi:hypothetical protein